MSAEAKLRGEGPLGFWIWLAAWALKRTERSFQRLHRGLSAAEVAGLRRDLLDLTPEGDRTRAAVLDATVDLHEVNPWKVRLQDGLCECPVEKRNWYGIGKMAVAPPSPDEEPWVRLAQREFATQHELSNRVLCEACGKRAGWKPGDPVGQMGLTGAGYVLRCWAEEIERRRGG